MKVAQYLVLIAFTVGCGKNDAVNYILTDEMKAWIVYDDGEKVYFRNNAGMIDSFYAGEKYINKNQHKSSDALIDLNPDKYNFETTGITLNRSDDDSQFIIIQVQAQPDSYEVYLHFLIEKISFNIINTASNSTISFIDSMTIGGYLYYDIVLSNSYFDDVLIKNIFYNQQFGLLRWEEYDGDSWELVN